MPRYRLKPPEVDAIQYVRANLSAVLDFCSGVLSFPDPAFPDKAYLDTVGGTVKLSANDWIIRNDAMEFSLMRPAEFAATYELVA